jgi:predicted metalloprotease with PDZ domain
MVLRRLALFLLLSVLLHLLVHLCTLPRLQHSKPIPPFNVTIVAPKPKDVDSPDQYEEKLLEKRQKMSGVCDLVKNYVGIGLSYSLGTMLVIEVHPDYPAARAGVQLGDMIVLPFKVKDGVETLKLVRGYDIIVIQIKQEKICVG